MKCNKRLQFIKNIDIFGKSISLFYKGKTNQKTYSGSILTILYAIIYISFVIYKLIRMFRRQDLTFYDTYSYIDKPPEINITSKNFYGGFALEDPKTYDNFVDETIYYPKVQFKVGKREGDNWNWTIKDVEVEKCKLEKFGSSFQGQFVNKSMDNLYCIKEVDETLIGHFSYDHYSFYFIEFFPCVNTTENNNHCKPVEIIDQYLSKTFVSFTMQDIELTPQVYKEPVRPKPVDTYTTVDKRLFQEIHVYFQIVNVITDKDLIGLTEFKYTRLDQYLKYESNIQMTNIIENNIYETGESFCSVTIKLSERILTEKRRYTKLVEVMRDIGGLTELLLSIFQIMSSFSFEILYETSVINNLFDFDIDKKLVLIHNRYKDRFSKFEEIRTIRTKKEDSNNANVESNTLKTRLSKHDIATRKNTIYRKRTLTTINANAIQNNEKKKKEETFMATNEGGADSQIISESSLSVKMEKKNIISNIKLNYFCIYLCFFFARSRKNMDNILLNEGRRIIMKELDIINFFKKLFVIEDFLDYDLNVKMSNTCINCLHKLGENANK